MGRGVSVSFGTLFVAMALYAVYRLATDDLDGLGFVGALFVLIGGLGAAYTYFAHAAFNTTGKAEGPEGGA